MNKWVSVNAENGVVNYTMQLSNDNDRPGDVPNQEFIRVDFATPDDEFIGSYYDFDKKQFVRLPPKPSDDYDFDGDTKQWLLNVERASQNAVTKRNQLLYACDWTQLPDAPVDKSAWASYRQALRDITEQPNYPKHIEWPTIPA